MNETLPITEKQAIKAHHLTNANRHGLSSHPLNRIWRSMKDRCHNEKSHDYSYYGLRGINVCYEWQINFTIFYEWAIGKWVKGLQLDRVDNNGNYCPENCRFVTRKVNGRNKRNNRLIEYNSQVKTIGQWQEETGIDRRKIHYRLLQGWSFEKILNTYKNNHYE